MRGLGSKVTLDVVLAGMQDDAPLVRAEAAHVCAGSSESTATRGRHALSTRWFRPRAIASAWCGRPRATDSPRSASQRSIRSCAPWTRATCERARWPRSSGFPWENRADFRAFAVSAVQQAVERHGMGAALEDDGGEAVRLLKDSLLFLSERDAVLGLRAAR